MGRLFVSHPGGNRIFSCAKCDTPLTNRSELLSVRFTGATGRAYLFNHVANLDYSEVQDRVMLTGNHLVRDVACRVCETKLGWMYEYAVEETQRYKEGRVILERALVTESEDLVEDRVGTATFDTGLGSGAALDSATGSGTPTSSEPEPTPLTANAAAAVLYALEPSSR